MPYINRSRCQDKIGRIVRLLKTCKSILFITGAGLSADSGLPTYRGISGLYRERITGEGVPVETALAGETVKTNPALTWKYIARIEERCRRAKPSRGHEVIKEMESRFERVWVLTQNVDGLHRVAGSCNVIDIHGDIYRLICPKCMRRQKVRDYSEIEIPPHCPVCNSIVRPEVVFFGELLPEGPYRVMMSELEKGFDIYFSIGTTSFFPYIQQPIFQAKSMNRPTVEINPEETVVSSIVDVKLYMRASEALDEIWRKYQTEKNVV